MEKLPFEGLQRRVLHCHAISTGNTRLPDTFYANRIRGFAWLMESVQAPW